MGSLLDNLKGGRTSKPKGRSASRAKSKSSGMKSKSRYVAKAKKAAQKPKGGKP